MDTYIEQQDPAIRSLLTHLRDVISKAAPEAEKSLVYSLPAFKYKGHLVGFAVMKSHVSFFIMSPTLAETMKDEITITHKLSGATIHFSAAQPLPDTLVQKIVRLRLAENEAKNKS